VRDPLLKELERTPAWRDGAVRALDAHGPALKARSRSAKPALLLRAAELVLAAGGAGQALSLVQHLAKKSVSRKLQDRLEFLAQRLAARTPEAPVKVREEEPTDPLGQMRLATLRAEIATYQSSHLGERSAGWRTVLAAPEDGTGASLAADELRFLAATNLAQILLMKGEADEARELLQRAAELAQRYDAPHDEASLQTWLYLACQQLEDTEAMIAVGKRAAELPSGAVGTLPQSVRRQLDAVEAMKGGDPVESIQALDHGLQEAEQRQDWTGYAALAQSKFLAFEALEQPYFAYRTLKLAGSLLRRHGSDDLAKLIKRLEQRVRRGVDEETWAEFGQRLISETQANP